MDRNSAPTYQEESVRPLSLPDRSALAPPADPALASQAAQSLADTHEFVNFVRDKCQSPLCGCGPDDKGKAEEQNGASEGEFYPTDLVQPIITPRFAISCSDELLQGLGEIVKADPTLRIQTHLAENPTEIQFTKCKLPLRSFRPRTTSPACADHDPYSSRHSALPDDGLVHGRVRLLRPPA
jgi:hypothetical protein